MSLVNKFLPDLIIETGESLLEEAVPNPAGNKTQIATNIGAADVSFNSTLVLRNLMGNVILSYTLKPGIQHTTINTATLAPGLYMYSLVINGKIRGVKKLSVVR